MVVFGSTYRNIQNVVPSLNLLSSAYLCLKESDWRKGILASDSTGVETYRYDSEVRLVKSKRKFEKILVKQYLKWHVTAILDHLIILSTRLTSKKTRDSPVLRTMLDRLKKYGVDLAGSIFNADKGYDGERNFESLFGIYVLPIKQRTNAKKRKNRKKAAKIFNASIYQRVDRRNIWCRRN